MAFYTYNQNNSGGSFDGDNYIIIEADNAAEANEIAERRTPIYFNGCADGRDCDCCGDRWYKKNDDWSDADEAPTIYGLDVTLTDEELLKDETFLDGLHWFGMNYSIYYANGTVVQRHFNDEFWTRVDEAKRTRRR